MSDSDIPFGSSTEALAENKYIFQSILLLSVPAHFLCLQRQLESPNWPNSPLGFNLLQAAYSAKEDLKAQIKLCCREFSSVLCLCGVRGAQCGGCDATRRTHQIRYTMAQNPDQQGSGVDPALPTNFCSLEFIVEKTTL